MAEGAAPRTPEWDELERDAAPKGYRLRRARNPAERARYGGAYALLCDDNLTLAIVAFDSVDELRAFLQL